MLLSDILVPLHYGSCVYNCFLSCNQYITKHSFGELDPKRLTENNNFYLIRLTRIALGNEGVKEDLRSGKNGIFEINYIKWRKIVNKVEQEELESILAQGIEDI